MDAPRPQKFLIVENDTKFAKWVQHAVSAGWPDDSLVIMDWTSFGRVRTAMTVRDYDIGGSIASAQLHYRSSVTGGLFVTLPMRAETTLDTFGALIPASAVTDAGTTDLDEEDLHVLSEIFGTPS